MRINPEYSFDYIYEATLFNQRTSFNEMNNWFDVMMEQASIILETASLDILTEDVAVSATKAVKNAGKKVSTGVKKFIEFIKNMFNRFMEFMTSLFRNNEKWLAEREKDFSSMNYKGISVSVVPYWEGNAIGTSERILREIGTMVDEYGLLDSSKSLSSEELQKALDNTDPKNFLSKYATNGDHIDGIKNIMRVNNKDGKDSVELSDETLKARIHDFFIPNVKEYKKFSDMTKKIVDGNETTLTKIDGAISKRSTESTQESFLLMNERLYVSEASLFLPVVEAEINTNQPSNTEDKKENGNAKDSTHGTTKVEVNKTSEQDRAENEEISNTSTNVLKIARNYAKCSNVVLAALLTVMEERMSLSMNVLKAVYGSANTRHGRKGNTEGQEEKK